MTILRSSLNSNMQRPRVQSPGWAAFDHKQREKQGITQESDVDPFPSISKINSSGPTRNSVTNHHTPIKSFSSVIRPSVEFPLLVGNSKSGTVHNNSSDDNITAKPNVTPVKMLNDIHSWADENLIEDILSAVDNDVNQASVLLKAMVTPDSKLQSSDSVPGSTVCYPCKDKTKCLRDSNTVENKISDNVPGLLISKRLVSVPVEPEWEEDDVYLSHRKDAMRTMRIAAQCSRAASNAFRRGDHVSAHQLSLRAHQQWTAAEKLNTKAADEILHIRNKNNDMWKIDLHGLHATEAVNALKEHLNRIESGTLMNRSASYDGLAKLEAGIQRSSSSESISGSEPDNEAKRKKGFPQQRQTVLHVITGTGTHSRGQASLPTAIKSFLIENGYRFDDARAGVFAVRPKFRHI